MCFLFFDFRITFCTFCTVCASSHVYSPACLLVSPPAFAHSDSHRALLSFPLLSLLASHTRPCGRLFSISALSRSPLSLPTSCAYSLLLEPSDWSASRTAFCSPFSFPSLCILILNSVLLPARRHSGNAYQSTFCSQLTCCYSVFLHSNKLLLYIHSGDLITIHSVNCTLRFCYILSTCKCFAC